MYRNVNQGLFVYNYTCVRCIAEEIECPLILIVQSYFRGIMEKVDIQKLLDSKSDRVTFEINKGKSDVWQLFKVVLVDGVSVPFVTCNR